MQIRTAILVGALLALPACHEEPGVADRPAVGSGMFLYDPPGEREPLPVYYHLPRNYSPDSRFLLVVPGAGRNADAYRDAWIEESERFSVVVFSPQYAEGRYDFGAYHLVGTMREMNLTESARYREDSNVVDLDESKLTFTVEGDSDRWILGDFDRIFDQLAAMLGSTRKRYDAFGHSAGGQILHRLALLRPNSRAERILAGNSGFYTLPDTTVGMPFGLAELPIDDAQLATAFAAQLVVLSGELDDETETGGIMLRSPSADAQGIGRNARAGYFHRYGKVRAQAMGVPFNWTLVEVPGVGHDHRKMGDAAAVYLYGR